MVVEGDGHVEQSGFTEQDNLYLPNHSTVSRMSFRQADDAGVVQFRIAFSLLMQRLPRKALSMALDGYIGALRLAGS